MLLIPVGNSIERIIYKKCHKNKICSSFAALSGFTDSTLSDLEKLNKNVRHEVSLFRGLWHNSTWVGVFELFSYSFVNYVVITSKKTCKIKKLILMLCQPLENPKLLRILLEVDGFLKLSCCFYCCFYLFLSDRLTFWIISFSVSSGKSSVKCDLVNLC